MIKPLEIRKDPVASLDDIEKQMERVVESQKAEIEKTLTEKITRQKEEAQKMIEATEKQFSGVRNILAQHRAAMAEFQTAKDHIQSQIREHLDRAGSHRRMIEKISLQAGDELQQIGALERDLTAIKGRVQEKVAAFRKYLDETHGIKAELQANVDTETVPAGWTDEIVKMKKILEILATGNGLEAADQEEPELGSEAVLLNPAAERVPLTVPAPMATESGEPQVPLEDQVEQVMAYDAEPPAQPEAAEEHEADDVRGILESLEHYRRTEPVVNGTEFAYFQKNGHAVLDGEFLISTMTKVFAEAAELHEALKQKESIKDVFMIKQEILNQQEILRKIFLRAVKFCEKEDGSLPLYISTVINVAGLKDFLERLTMGNWSNASDFDAFQSEASELKSTFEGRVARRRDFIQSILDQVEGRAAATN